MDIIYTPQSWTIDVRALALSAVREYAQHKDPDLAGQFEQYLTLHVPEWDVQLFNQELGKLLDAAGYLPLVEKVTDEMLKGAANALYGRS